MKYFEMASIQKAQIQDFPAIAELNVEAYCEYADSLTAEAWMTLQTNLRAIETVSQRAVFLIALLSSELAGSVAYCPPGNSVAPIPPDWASVLLLAISPRYRRHGIARSLTQACIWQANQEGAQTIGLFTSELMTGACQLYESLGFYKDCEIPQRHGIRYWRYRLDLAAT
jgi:ribosomal protein S18 acetylase RimI-like enzyme